MHHEPILSDLIRAHERDLRSAADQHRLARSVRPDRPALLGHLRVATLAWLARGARRIAPETTRDARRTAPETTRGPAPTAAAVRPRCRRAAAAHPDRFPPRYVCALSRGAQT
jgi:hypothetical protein